MSDARARRRKAALALVAVLAAGAGGLALWLRSRAGEATPSEGHGGGGGTAQAPTALREREGIALASNPRTPAPPGAGAPAMTVEPPSAPATDPSTWKDIRFALVDAVTGRPLDRSVVTHPPSLVFGEAGAELRIEPAAGYVAGEQRHFRFEPPLGTVAVSVVYPIHRSIDFELTVLDADGRLLVEPGWDMIQSRDCASCVPIESTQPGHYLLRRRPFEPGAPLHLLLLRAEPPGPEPEPMDPGTSRVSAHPLTVRMPGVHVARSEMTVQVDHYPSGSRGAGYDLGPRRSHSRAPSGGGAVRVRARRRDGSPAVGARVWWERASQRDCDLHGVAILRDIDAGRQLISLADPQLVPITIAVDVRADETVEIELVEPEPAMLEVAVVDADGKGFPVARVGVETPSDMPALDLVDGVLRLDPYTDEYGRRTFTRVEPGPVVVRASGRGVSGEAKVNLRPGLRSAVTVVVQ